MKVRLFLASLCMALGSCGATKNRAVVIDPVTGEETVTTVGDLAADQVEATGSIWAGLLGKVIGVATGNPVAGLAGGTLLTQLVLTGASALRPKKQPEVEHTDAAA